MSESNKQAGVAEMQEVSNVEKRVRTPTFKGIRFAMERLQTERNGNFTQANKLKAQVAALMTSEENGSVIQQKVNRIKMFCQKATELHNTLLMEFPIPEDEQEKQNAWFNSNITSSDLFIEDVSKWLQENGIVGGEVSR